MKNKQKELLEHLLSLAETYYTEKTECGAYKIPDNQKEKQFIQEVFMVCSDILDEQKGI